jgi:hypothetical protein
MTNQPAAQISPASPSPTQPGIREQLALNREVVVYAEAAPTAEVMHPARWERQGLLQRLNRSEWKAAA